MNKTKKVWNVITSILVILVVILAIALVGVRVVGIEPYTVLSASMEPKYQTGSLIYVTKTDYKTLKVGDDITFMLDENTVATHQIIEIIQDSNDKDVLRFRTQGIANDTPDGGTVHCKNIIGKPIFTIPYLGYVASYIQKPPGLYIAVAGIVILLLLFFFPNIVRAFSDEKKESDNEGDNKNRG